MCQRLEKRLGLGLSTSRSRSRLGLGPQGLVYIPGVYVYKPFPHADEGHVIKVISYFLNEITVLVISAMHPWGAY